MSYPSHVPPSILKKVIRMVERCKTVWGALGEERERLTGRGRRTTVSDEFAFAKNLTFACAKYLT